MKKFILALVASFTFTFAAKAQDDFENLLLASQGDSEKLLQAYFSPLFEGFTSGMNNGWYHTAKAHKLFGFDVSIAANATFIPSEKEMFNINSLGLTSVTSTGGVNLPTVVGDNTETPMVISTTFQGQDVTANTTAPRGILGDLPLGAIPSPAVQLSLGMPWKSEVVLRFFPETKISDDGGKVKMMGFGLKKEITKWFGPMEKTPLHISILAAYTTVDIDYAIEDSSSGNILTNNAAAAFELRTYTIQAIASLNFPVINLFGGVGYGSGNTQLNTSGTITGVYETGLAAPNSTYSRAIDPISIDFDISGFTTTVGARLSLGFFKLFGSYTLQEYGILNAGLAFSFR